MYCMCLTVCVVYVRCLSVALTCLRLFGRVRHSSQLRDIATKKSNFFSRKNNPWGVPFNPSRNRALEARENPISE